MIAFFLKLSLAVFLPRLPPVTIATLRRSVGSIGAIFAFQNGESTWLARRDITAGRVMRSENESDYFTITSQNESVGDLLSPFSVRLVLPLDPFSIFFP